MPDIFDLTGTDPAGSNDVQIDPNKDYLAEYVGEGKKFQDVSALARAKAEADAFIERLKHENQEYRTKLNTAASIEQFLDQMKTQMQPNSKEPENQPQGLQNQEQPKVLTPEDIDRLLSEREATKARQANVDEANRVLAEKFGTQVQTVMAQKARELGVTGDYLRNLAAQSPKLLYRALGLEAPKDVFTPGVPRSDVNSQAGPKAPTGEKTASYYENLRKTNPEAYARTAAERHNQAIKLGPAYFDT